jgi:phosphoribosylformylglycinamidine synthase
MNGAVAGIGHYGNSIGVATVGGEILFGEPYEHNCLVNAMCVGIAPTERLVRSAAAGVGNLVVLLGALTGRDGIGGASVLASAELGEESASKRPSVQIGDPFEEKKVLECCLELLDRELLVSLQDLGAAGLSSSASEMASKGGVGIDLDVARVPRREPGMEPFEVMVSESQERMLCVVEPSRLDAVRAVCDEWDVRCTAIGAVTNTRRLRVLEEGEPVGDMPVEALVDDCPLYDLAPERPTQPVYAAPRARLEATADPAETLLALLRSENIASKRWAYEQYDGLVGSRTVRRPGSSDAAVLHLEHDGASGAIAVSIDGNGRRVACDPYVGAAEAVLECARNLACVGAEPLGLTNCLNFGNPEKPHIAWQLERAVSGLADGCRALGVPVVGGNVSLYNEGGGGPIYPTPVVGMVGRVPAPDGLPNAAFVAADHAIALLGPYRPALAGSELEAMRGRMAGSLPALDLEAHARALAAARAAARSGGLATAHDVSDGGLACALAESCLGLGVGARVDLGPLLGRLAGNDDTVEAALFGEGPGGIVVAGRREAVEELMASLPPDTALPLGETGGERLAVETGTGARLEVAVAAAREAFERGVADHF